MEGRKHWLASAVLLTALVGCTKQPRAGETPAPEPAAELAHNFDPAATGTLLGHVVWEGPIPTVPVFEVYPNSGDHPDLPPRGTRPNPHVSQVNRQNHGVADAVVFLRQVDLSRSRPWDHEPVRIEQRDWQIDVVQGSVRSALGFVRRGTTFQAVSRQKILHILHGSGACWLSLPFPDPDVVSTRALANRGHVELSSGSCFFWMRAHLFVDDHPYYARTGLDGSFVLPQVPAGTYQIVCWLPNWNVARHARDPESAVVSRVEFCAPLKKEASATVKAGETAKVDFVVSETDFARPPEVTSQTLAAIDLPSTSPRAGHR